MSHGVSVMVAESAGHYYLPVSNSKQYQVLMHLCVALQLLPHLLSLHLRQEEEEEEEEEVD